MDQLVKVENNIIICLKSSHNDPIEMVAIDDQIPLSERLLCLKCFKAKKQVSQYIDIDEAQEIIQEKLHKLTKHEEEQKHKILNLLIDVNLWTLDEILRITQLWITDINNYGRKSGLSNFLEDLQLLQQKSKIDSDYLEKSNHSHYKKIDQIFEKLMAQDYYQHCKIILQNIFQIQRKDTIKQQTNLQNVKSVKIHNIIEDAHGLDNQRYAIAFNNSGSIMVVGCKWQNIVWNFNEGKINEMQYLQESVVYCLVFSKKHNWFVTECENGSIRAWKEDAKQVWIGAKPEQVHSYSVKCLILNNQEDELLSCSVDNTIKVCKANYSNNQIEYYYTLEKKHTNCVHCISLNDSETDLVSCGSDSKIILWRRDKYNIFQYQNELKMDDLGYRISFISEYQIIWQQCHKGITHFLEIQEGKLILKPEFNLTLNELDDDFHLFPTIRNKRRQIIIQKHNCYVYILKYQPNGKLSIVKQINCQGKRIVGNLTEDGKYLIISKNVKEFAICKINYD